MTSFLFLYLRERGWVHWVGGGVGGKKGGGGEEWDRNNELACAKVLSKQN